MKYIITKQDLERQFEILEKENKRLAFLYRKHKESKEFNLKDKYSFILADLVDVEDLCLI